MLTTLARVGLAAAVLAPMSLPAQEGATVAPGAGASLRAALAKTGKLDSFAFKSVESQDDALRRRMPIGGSEDTQVSGTATRDMLQASIGFDDDQVVLAGSRMLARRGDGDWKLRRGCLVDGRPLPFVADPHLLLETLTDLPDDVLKVTRVEEGSIKDTKVVTYSFSLGGEPAQDLSLSGALPRSSGGGMMVILGGGGHVDAPKPEITLDFAVSVDPQTGYVVRLHSKGYHKSELPGNVQMRFAGADGVEFGADEDADEPVVAAKDAALEFSKGLPKRRLDKNTSMTDFDLTLSKHGEAKAPELSAAGRRLLGRR